jgi:hypothetical protein
MSSVILLRTFLELAGLRFSPRNLNHLSRRPASPIGRRQIKPDDVAHLVDEQRVIGKSQCEAAASRKLSRSFESSCAKNKFPPQSNGSAGVAPDHSGNLIVVDRSRSAGRASDSP